MPEPTVAYGIDLGPLAPRVPEVLRTPSGKIELAPALLLDDLKHAEEDLAAPSPDLVVIGRRDLRSNNSWMHNLPVLAKGPQRCTALVHPADAARCGVTPPARFQMRLSPWTMATTVSSTRYRPGYSPTALRLPFSKGVRHFFTFSDALCRATSADVARHSFLPAGRTALQFRK